MKRPEQIETLSLLGITNWRLRQSDSAMKEFGSGNPNADIMFISDTNISADEQGELFTRMLAAIKLEREQVYIIEDAINNLQLLNQQISRIQPKLLVAVGHRVAHYLLKNTEPLDSLRGRTHTYEATNTPLIATYHPAHLLTHPGDKRKSYQDLLQIQKSHTCHI